MNWDALYEEQIATGAFSTAPVEAVVRTLAYDFRVRLQTTSPGNLRFLDMGCGAGSNLQWLSEKGVDATGVDLSLPALRLANHRLARAGAKARVAQASAARVPFQAASFDGIIEANVFQHLERGDRERAFSEIGRLLKPGGVFVGYMMDVGHTVYQLRKHEELPGDPGTLILREGGSPFHLSNVGTAHFFRKAELERLLAGFRLVEPCLTTYYLPPSEAERRGYDSYFQSMWTVYAIR